MHLHPNSHEARERERMMRISKQAQEYVRACTVKSSDFQLCEIGSKVKKEDLPLFYELVRNYFNTVGLTAKSCDELGVL